MTEEKKPLEETLFEKYNEFIVFELKDVDRKLIELVGVVGFYQSSYFTLKKKFDIYSNKLDRMWTEKYLYYKNEYNITLNNTEIKQFIEKDLEYLDQKMKVQTVKTLVEQVELTLKGLDSLGWQLKTIVDWEKFKQGSY